MHFYISWISFPLSVQFYAKSLVYMGDLESFQSITRKKHYLLLFFLEMTIVLNKKGQRHVYKSRSYAREISLKECLE